jgi:Protein of unknown function DUF262
MQRRYVWRAPRVRDLLDSLYRSYPSGAILLWDTDESVPLQEFAVTQEANPFSRTRLLLDGQQRLTSLSAVIRGEPVTVRGRVRPIELLFNLEHPEHLSVVTQVNEESDDEKDLADDEVDRDEEAVDSDEDELQRRFERMTFVVATRKLAAVPHWVKVAEVFKTSEDAPFLQRAGICSPWLTEPSPAARAQPKPGSPANPPCSSTTSTASRTLHAPRIPWNQAERAGRGRPS